MPNQLHLFNYIQAGKKAPIGNSDPLLPHHILNYPANMATSSSLS